MSSLVDVSDTHTHTHLYIYIYTRTPRARYMCMCMYIYIYTHPHAHARTYMDSVKRDFVETWSVLLSYAMPGFPTVCHAICVEF